MIARAARRAAVIVVAAFLSAPATATPARPDPTRMTAPEVTALQRRLTDARCYDGPLDGQASPALQKALAACPDPRPTLRIETGMHVAEISRIGTDTACRLLATSSIDKTVRLWAMPEGRLIRTQRLPIGGGEYGKLFAVAVSPDGSLVAAGGADEAYETSGKQGVYLFDSATGTQMRHLGAFDGSTFGLAFSPDGRRLAVSLGLGHGLRVLDVATGGDLMADRDFGGKPTYGAVFGPDGSLYAVGLDGSLRRYGPDLRPARRVKTAGGREPFSVAVDPSGRRLVVGYADSTTVDLYDARDLHRIRAADTKDIDKINLYAVAWWRDGRRFSAGGYFETAGHTGIRTFTADGRRDGKDAAVAKSTIKSLSPCGEAMAFGSAGPTFGLVRPDGEAVTLGQGRAANMAGKLGAAFTVSPDGRRVRFGEGIGALGPVLFDLAKASLVESPNAPPDLVEPDTSGLAVAGWKDADAPRLGGRPIALSPYEASLSMAVRPDRVGFVLGTVWNLRAYDAAGKERWPPISAPAETKGVNLARGGDLIVAAYHDGTIRWHRWSDGRELLALFVNRENDAWVAWTPTGYYSASPGAEDMIGWHVNRGWEQPADFFPASKFRDQYARPDIVERVLDTLDEAEAVRQANAAKVGKPSEAVPIAERLPPVVTILSPSEGSAVEGESVRIEYSVRSPSGLPVEAVEALIDGRPPAGERGLGRDNADQQAVRECLTGTRGLGRSEGGLQGCRGSLSLRLPPGTSEIGLFARTGGHPGDVAKLRLTRSAAASGQELAKPRLFALVVGISAYANPDYRLGFAAKDAADFANALKNQQGGLYAEVNVRALADGSATAAAIRDGLDWLRRQVTRRDVGLVYLAGHGVLDDRERFYFLAADGDADRLRATAVPREDIQDALDGLSGKALLFLDACHSGAIAARQGGGRGLNINNVANEFASSERGVVAFTASTGRQLSQENPAWGNGAFTKAVTEALGMAGAKAKGDLLGTGQITTSALDLYVSNRVKGLTNGEQSPIMIRPPTVPDFTLAVVR